MLKKLMPIIPANLLARRRIAQKTEEGQLTLDAWGVRITEDSNVSVVDVIAHVKKMNPPLCGRHVPMLA